MLPEIAQYISGHNQSRTTSHSCFNRCTNAIPMCKVRLSQNRMMVPIQLACTQWRNVCWEVNMLLNETVHEWIHFVLWTKNQVILMTLTWLGSFSPLDWDKSSNVISGKESDPMSQPNEYHNVFVVVFLFCLSKFTHVDREKLTLGVYHLRELSTIMTG